MTFFHYGVLQVKLLITGILPQSVSLKSSIDLWMDFTKL